MNEYYTEEQINKLVRAALKLERHSRYKDALEIYYDLAEYVENEFAIDRIPVIKYREEQFRLRKVNFFIGVVSFITIVIALLTVTVSTVNNIANAGAISSKVDKTYLTHISNSKLSSRTNENKIELNYHTVKTLDKNLSDSSLDIFVNKNITSTQLKKRILEGLDTYLSEYLFSESDSKILIKTYSSREIIGYVDLKNANIDKFDVYLLK